VVFRSRPPSLPFDYSAVKDPCPQCRHEKEDHPRPGQNNLNRCAICVWLEDEGLVETDSMCALRFGDPLGQRIRTLAWPHPTHLGRFAPLVVHKRRCCAPDMSVPSFSVDVVRGSNACNPGDTLATLQQTSLDQLSDHDLLLGGITATIAENRGSAEKWDRLVHYFRRRVSDDTERRGEAGHFALTARQQTVAEVSPLWGLAESRVRHQLNTALWLSEHFRHAWNLCRAGQLDRGRAELIADAARHGLDTVEEFEALAARLTRFLDRHLTLVPGAEIALVTCSTTQLRNKLAYEIRKLRAADAQARFTRAYEARDVRAQDGDDGISWLTLSGTTDQVQLASHRLTLAARKLRAEGDPRTVDQLRADLALDLLVRGSTEQTPLPAFARPVVNLTVPIQTVLGITDDPGVLSGGTVIPAGLARRIAQTPGATWHRMLTDPAGLVVERSTTRYQPTRSIWEQVVSEQTTCFRPGCDRASTLAELDHRIPWPAGPTAGPNLWPACKADHKAKHSPGFTIQQTATGGFTLTTAAGFTHPVLLTEHPQDGEWPDVTRIQYSATEIVQALDDLRARDLARRPFNLSLEWEHDLRDLVVGVEYRRAA